MAQIVVVEDDLYMREELIDLLNKSGYDTFPILEFEDVVSQIQAIAPDLILLDINLPYKSGFDICRELKAKGIGGVLVLTARDKLQKVNPRSHLYGLAIQDFPAHSQPIYTTLTPKSTTWSPDNKSQVGPVLPV